MRIQPMSILLVAVQFILILLILVPWPEGSHFKLIAFAIQGIGLALGAWTLYFNRIGNFNILPEPKDGGRLVTKGPYRFVRHPMYAAVLLIMGACALFSNESIKLAWWVFLLAVLWRKASMEETMLRARFPEYEHYWRSTGRFMPRLLR